MVIGVVRYSQQEDQEPQVVQTRWLEIRPLDTDWEAPNPAGRDNSDHSLRRSTPFSPSPSDTHEGDEQGIEMWHRIKIPEWIEDEDNPSNAIF